MGTMKQNKGVFQQKWYSVIPRYNLFQSNTCLIYDSYQCENTTERGPSKKESIRLQNEKKKN